jgi:hypothetical protein
MNFRLRTGLIEIPTSDPYLRSFLVMTKDGQCRVNVWSNKKSGLYTVGTALAHPKKGKTQMFRRNCTEAEVRELLKNPRKHTGKGYQRREHAR